MSVGLQWGPSTGRSAKDRSTNHPVFRDACYGCATLEPEDQQLTTGFVEVQILQKVLIFIGNDDRVASNSASVGAQSSSKAK